MSTPENSATPIAIYQSGDGSMSTEIRLKGESVWLRQEQISQLFGRGRGQLSASTCAMSLPRANLKLIQYVQNLHILLPMNLKGPAQLHISLKLF
ncbi:MAG TPA: hypothetical protein VMW07_01580 [Gallionella sp.]|nr:hypothetical protein [Gallionella sp.]